MSARLIDGKALAERVKARLKEEVATLTPRLGRAPGLAVVLVGADPASEVYVRNKTRAAAAVGIAGQLVRLAGESGTEAVLRTVGRLNDDPAVDGILVQLPLPRAVDEAAVLEAVDPLKDVDGFHPFNAGLLAQGRPRFAPCTPSGIVEMLADTGVETRGKQVVVVGRSNIVGKPMTLLLLQKGPGGDATVTVCHSASRGIEAIAREADILVVAMGRPEAVGVDWVKPGAVVIDVGIHKRADGSLCGDVQFDAVAEVASAITPVPGGVGPMTVAMLLANTTHAARMRLERS